MRRGYDTLRLYLRDALIRIRYLSDEIIDLQKTDEKLQKEATICEEPFPYPISTNVSTHPMVV